MPKSSRAPQRVSIHNVRDRAAAFKEYKQRTGAWPVPSMALYAGRFVLIFAAISVMFWYGRLHAGSTSQITLKVLLIAPLCIFLWTALEVVAWNYDLRRKQLTSRGMFLTLKQFPGE